jgi:hypothetical protein
MRVRVGVRVRVRPLGLGSGSGLGLGPTDDDRRELRRLAHREREGAASLRCDPSTVSAPLPISPREHRQRLARPACQAGCQKDLKVVPLCERERHSLQVPINTPPGSLEKGGMHAV